MLYQLIESGLTYLGGNNAGLAILLIATIGFSGGFIGAAICIFAERASLRRERASLRRTMRLYAPSEAPQRRGVLSGIPYATD